LKIAPPASSHTVARSVQRWRRIERDLDPTTFGLQVGAGVGQRVPTRNEHQLIVGVRNRRATTAKRAVGPERQPDARPEEIEMRRIRFGRPWTASVVDARPLRAGLDDSRTPWEHAPSPRCRGGADVGADAVRENAASSRSARNPRGLARQQPAARI
jgi:hypothetical protein